MFYINVSFNLSCSQFKISSMYHFKDKKKETLMFQRDKKISCKHLRNII